LSREALERAAYRHLSRAPHLRLHATKAMAMHLADSVWVDVKRPIGRLPTLAYRAIPVAPQPLPQRRSGGWRKSRPAHEPF